MGDELQTKKFWVSDNLDFVQEQAVTKCQHEGCETVGVVCECKRCRIELCAEHSNPEPRGWEYIFYCPSCIEVINAGTHCKFCPKELNSETRTQKPLDDLPELCDDCYIGVWLSDRG